MEVLLATFLMFRTIVMKYLREKILGVEDNLFTFMVHGRQSPMVGEGMTTIRVCRGGIL